MHDLGLGSSCVFRVWRLEFGSSIEGIDVRGF